MMDFAEARKVAQMLAALAEPTRLRIVYQLANQSYYVSQLAEVLGVPMVNLSHHLGVMRQAGFVEDEKSGRRVVYRFRPDVFQPGDGTDILGVLQIGPIQVRLRVNGEPIVLPKPKRKSGSK